MKKLNALIIGSHNQIELMDSICSNVKSTQFTAIFVDNLDLSFELFQQTANLMQSVDFIVMVIDKELLENRYLLHLIRRYKIEDKKIINIVTDNSKLPNGLSSYLYYTYKGEQDLQKVINKLENITISKSKYQLTKTGILTVTVFSILASFALLILFLTWFAISETRSIYIGISILATMLAMVAAFFSFSFLLIRKKREENFYTRNRYAQKLERTIVTKAEEKDDSQQGKKSDTPELDALGRMLVNLEDIKEYYEWSHKQAKMSFKLALWLCIGGFLLIVTSFVVPIIFKLGIQISIISVIGGISVEFIAGTALVVYKSSLKQLNYYHKALHEDERFLSSVNLLNKFEDQKTRDEMLKEIIRSELNMNINSHLELEKESMK